MEPPGKNHARSLSRLANRPVASRVPSGSAVHQRGIAFGGRWRAAPEAKQQRMFERCLGATLQLDMLV